MDNFRIIYKILHILERAMDLDEFNADDFSRESENIREPMGFYYGDAE